MSFEEIGVIARGSWSFGALGTVLQEAPQAEAASADSRPCVPGARGTAIAKVQAANNPIAIDANT
jgi:hypothetical protein